MIFKTPYRFSCKEYSYSLFVLCLIMVGSCQKDIQSKLSQPTTNCAPGTIVTDFDGNSYNVVNIGSQCWMKENLKTTHYRNGDTIPNVMADSIWKATTSGAYCVYDNDTLNGSIYGNIYNSYAIADPRLVCPIDWHLPTKSEWSILGKFLDPNVDTTISCGQWVGVGGYLKSTGTLQASNGLWEQPNLGAVNSVGFSALPGGLRYEPFEFGFINEVGMFWTSSNDSATTMQIFISLIHNSENIEICRIQNFDYGMSVRCIKD
jgi:uncharacterized protein (TIGR02145 family)